MERASRHRAINLLWIILLFSGCTIPVTDGYHHELPKAGTRIIVWGNHPSVVVTATTWLKKRGLFTLEPASIVKALDQKDIRWVQTYKDEVAVLRAAQQLGAEEVVFTNRSGDRRAPMVSVRGVRVENDQVVWIGNGRYPHYSKNPENDILAELTCEALATAWGFRPPGEEWTTSSLERCMVDEKNKIEKGASDG